MKKRIALLSNVNMNFVIRMLKEEFEVYEAEGYGNELGLLLDKNSSYHRFQPEITVFIIDLLECLAHNLTVDEKQIETWFSMLEKGLEKEQLYFISDAYLWGIELRVIYDSSRKQKLEALWQEKLEKLCTQYSNVKILPYHHAIEEIGENRAFSLKMWYMGRILHTNEAQKSLCSLISKKVKLLSRVVHKVLLLDLDNTLWGGLAGENDHTPILLSEEQIGLAYKNLQRVILQMQRQGVLLGIVSKNNEEDAMNILEKHPHCVLRPQHFAVCKINWKPKYENIREIAEELNIGLDAFVFWDDSPAERELVASMLPEVAVPDFPKRPEELAPAMAEIYQEYFQQAVLTKEDQNKTQQYAANVKRRNLEKEANDFYSYLKQLEIVITKVNPQQYIERLTQLFNKTNQFNLTTKRHEQIELQNMLQDKSKQIFLYQVEDCFGENGITAAAIIDKSESVPIIEEFVMSCRIMGKNIEYAIIEDIEKSLQQEGYQEVKSWYLPTAKNKPVEFLYEQLGYQLIFKDLDNKEAYKEYIINFSQKPERKYFAKIQ